MKISKDLFDNASHIITIREPKLEDKKAFLAAMLRSQSIHQPWINAPLTPKGFDEYLQRSKQSNQKSFLVIDHSEEIAGVFNINEIVRGSFQNAFLGFYVVSDFAGKGYMSAGLKLILDKIFYDLSLHRIEANIQPENIHSIQLVKKNGFRYEGYSPRYLKINGEWRGHEHWVMTYEDFVKNDVNVTKKDHINLASYNPNWPDMANLEIKKLREALPIKIIDIQHVGSTAISGLSAKPIIDIQIAVNSLDDIKPIIINELQKLGYEYWAENPDPTRMFFAKGMPPYGEGRTHHVHVVAYDSDHWRNKIIFRDYLRLHADVAQEYVQLKKLLSSAHKHDREKYTDMKTKFINKILQLAKKI